jgi:hypothetical protein
MKPGQTKRKSSSFGAWALAVIVVAVAIAAGVVLWRQSLQGGAPAQAPAPAGTTGAPASPGSAPIRLPISEAAPAAASTAPLPALAGSDSEVAESLLRLGGATLADLLLRDQGIARIVATVDALPRPAVATRLLPLRTPQGMFVPDSAGAEPALGPRIAQRYAPYLSVVDQLDAKAAVAWYVHYYPLFQQAYVELGYPHGYFNDRLIAAIDNLLAVPAGTGHEALLKSGPYYLFADPSLQSLSAGQKLLLRMGPEQAARVKAKLREIRSALVSQGNPGTGA